MGRRRPRVVGVGVAPLRRPPPPGRAPQDRVGEASEIASADGGLTALLAGTTRFGGADDTSGTSGLRLPSRPRLAVLRSNPNARLTPFALQS